jgi:hypothetical protein
MRSRQTQGSNRGVAELQRMLGNFAKQGVGMEKLLRIMVEEVAYIE